MWFVFNYSELCFITYFGNSVASASRHGRGMKRDSNRKTSASQICNISLFTPRAAEYFYITIILIIISFIIIKFADSGCRAL
jgi:hypothetical protein